MSITTTFVDSDVLLTLTDHRADANFSGYSIERQSDSVAWTPWNGSAWASPGVVVVSNRLSDYSLAAGLYQYRYRVVYTDAMGNVTYSAYEISEWGRVASSSSEKVGWTLGNYTVPEGEFGEVLTAEDIRSTYMWGVPFTSSGGAQFTNAQISNMIKAATAEFEHALNWSILPRVIVCADDVAPGAKYDELEDAYYYHRKNWNAGGRINLKRRPIASVQRLDLYTITGQKVLDLMPWLRIDHHKGVVHMYPKADASGLIKVFPAFMTMGNLACPDYNHGYRIAYTAGYADASELPADLRDIIGKATTCRLMNIIGAGLIAGFASMSLGMDGLSESFSTTASATSSLYGAHMKEYLDDIALWLKRNSRKFGSFVIGSL